MNVVFFMSIVMNGCSVGEEDEEYCLFNVWDCMNYGF